MVRMAQRLGRIRPRAARRRHQRPRHRRARRGCVQAARPCRPATSRAFALRRRDGDGCGGDRCRRADQARSRRLQHRSRVPHRRRRRRHLFRALPVAARGRPVDARLQLLLPAAALHFHHRRSLERRGAVLLHAGGRAGLQPDGTRAQPGDDRRQPGAHNRGALRVLTQARRLRRRRRRALGDGLPDRLDAPASRRGAAARGWASRGARRLPAGGRARRARPCRRAMVVGAQYAGGAGVPTRCLVRRAISRRCARGVVPSGWWGSSPTGPGPC